MYVVVLPCPDVMFQNLKAEELYIVITRLERILLLFILFHVISLLKEYETAAYVYIV
jgi:hypothetical protein